MANAPSYENHWRWSMRKKIVYWTCWMTLVSQEHRNGSDCDVEGHFGSGLEGLREWELMNIDNFIFNSYYNSKLLLCNLNILLRN